LLPEVPVGVAAVLEALADEGEDADALEDGEAAAALAAGDAEAGAAALGSALGDAVALADGLVVALPALAGALVALEDVEVEDVGDMEDEAADALGEAALPPAAFSKSIRCERNSTSLARTAGSTVVVPEVPTAPAVPVAGAGVAAAAVVSWLPISASMFAWTFV